MDNFTSCEEHFENLRNLIIERNISIEYMTYNGSNKGFWKNQDIIGYTKLIAYIIIIMGGLLGNLSVIMTVALIKSVRSAMNFYVANLAMADAMICIFCMLPHALIVYTRGKFVLGAFMCKFSPFTQSKSNFVFINKIVLFPIINKFVFVYFCNTSQEFCRSRLMFCNVA